MSLIGRFLLVVILLCACSRPGEKGAPRTSSVPASAPAAAPTPTAKPSKPSTSSSAPAAAPVVAAAAAEPTKEQPKIEEEDLKTEEREANPYSETVTLKLSVTPSVKALVLWGGKQVAHLEAGKMEAELTRPRGSGPVDLEIKAEGYLPYHTRLHADRNDKVGVHLYRPEEAPNLFGYKRSAEAKKAAGEKPQ